MFVDASALVAILLGEPDGPSLSARLEDNATSRLTSPLAVFEAALAVSRRQGGQTAQAQEIVMSFLAASGVKIVPVDEEAGARALKAHERYGKGRHPARLNFGDCFAYAMAKQHHVRLLYTGDDFARTDLA